MKCRIAKKIWKKYQSEYDVFFWEWVEWNEKIKNTNPESLKYVALKWLKPVLYTTHSKYQINKANKIVTRKLVI